MKTNLFFDEQGQTLLEAVAALGVALLIILALVQLTVVSVRNAKFAKDRALASQYAQEAVEEVRAYRDQNPTGFFGGSCPDLDDVGDFSREVVCEAESSGGDGIDKVKVTVTITLGGETQAELVTYLTKWTSIGEEE